MEIMVHSKKSVSSKVSNETVPFQQEYQFRSVIKKMIQLDIQIPESDKTI